MKNPERVSVKQAAKELCMTELHLRYLLTEEKINLGGVIKHPSRNTYLIYRGPLDKEKERLGGTG